MSFDARPANRCTSIDSSSHDESTLLLSSVTYARDPKASPRLVSATSSIPAFDPNLHVIRELFAFRDESSVVRHIARNRDICGPLVDAFFEISRVCGLAIRPSLEMAFDPDFPNRSVLLVLVPRSSDPAYDLQVLRQIDENWWLRVCGDLAGTLDLTIG